VTLLGRTLRLEPLEERHAAGFLSAADPETFRYIPDFPPEFSQAGVRAFIQSVPPDRAAFAVLSTDGEFLGSSSYFDVREQHLGLEIGHTWITERARGTHVNAEMKCLMLRHAFEVLGAIRVQLKTDARNERSQAAMKKLGLTLEGVLRNHIVMPDGYVRDTVMFSITNQEWPIVKAALLERLGYDP
jgi:RimJ/RimL family protein N-acetyltransferase